MLSNETALSREMVEGGVREVLQALSRSVAAKKSVEFDLKDIGRCGLGNVSVHIYVAWHWLKCVLRNENFFFIFSIHKGLFAVRS